MTEDGVKEHLREALVGANQTTAVDACERDDIDVIVLSQQSFGHSMTDILILGTLVKYAGVNGKKVMVLVKNGQSEE